MAKKKKTLETPATQLDLTEGESWNHEHFSVGPLNGLDLSTPFWLLFTIE